MWLVSGEEKKTAGCRWMSRSWWYSRNNYSVLLQWWWMETQRVSMASIDCITTNTSFPALLELRTWQEEDGYGRVIVECFFWRLDRWMYLGIVLYLLHCNARRYRPALGTCSSLVALFTRWLRNRGECLWGVGLGSLGMDGIDKSEFWNPSSSWSSSCFHLFHWMGPAVTHLGYSKWFLRPQRCVKIISSSAARYAHIVFPLWICNTMFPINADTSYQINPSPFLSYMQTFLVPHGAGLSFTMRLILAS